MPSERRLHPLSILFAFLAQVRALVVPGVLVLVGASSRGGDWQPWMMLFIIPSAIAAALRYVSFRYRYDANELVIRSGLIFRKERHIPYARIQNVDAVQRVLHRLLHVVEVRVQTGAGDEPEATMSVLPFAAFEEMRERVFAAQHTGSRVAGDLHRADGAGGAEGAESAASARVARASAETLLHLNTRELLLCGFIENRGAVVIAAALGVVWELGLVDRILDDTVGENVTGRGAMRALLRGIAANAAGSWDRLALVMAGFAAVLLVIRALSMGWAAVRLHGFTLRLHDDDLQTEYGLLTRVAANIPLRRIQTLTVRETPLLRAFTRVGVKVETAGGRGKDGRGTAAEREWLAPILHRAALPALVGKVLNGTQLDAVVWQPVAAGAFKREVKGWLVMMILIITPVVWLASWWALLLAPLLLVAAVVGARQAVAHLGWALTGDAVLFRRGWLWRRVSIVRFAKIQTVTVAQTPLDRRAVMARVRVDTAGASDPAGRVNIPYLTRETASALYTELSSQAAGTQFKW
jgi:putative membrane protein